MEVMIIFHSGSDEDSCDSRAYLKDLVETTHLFLRMLEKFTKTNNHLIVQAKKRKRRKKAKKGIGGIVLYLCVWIFSCFSGMLAKKGIGGIVLYLCVWIFSCFSGMLV